LVWKTFMLFFRLSRFHLQAYWLGFIKMFQVEFSNVLLQYLKGMQIINKQF